MMNRRNLQQEVLHRRHPCKQTCHSHHTCHGWEEASEEERPREERGQKIIQIPAAGCQDSCAALLLLLAATTDQEEQRTTPSATSPLPPLPQPARRASAVPQLGTTRARPAYLFKEHTLRAAHLLLPQKPDGAVLQHPLGATPEHQSRSSTPASLPVTRNPTSNILPPAAMAGQEDVEMQRNRTSKEGNEGLIRGD